MRKGIQITLCIVLPVAMILMGCGDQGNSSSKNDRPSGDNRTASQAGDEQQGREKTEMRKVCTSNGRTCAEFRGVPPARCAWTQVDGIEPESQRVRGRTCYFYVYGDACDGERPGKKTSDISRRFEGTLKPPRSSQEFEKRMSDLPHANLGCGR